MQDPAVGTGLRGLDIGHRSDTDVIQGELEMRTIRTLLVTAAATALALSACTSSGDQSNVDSGSDIVVDLSGYQEQSLEWGECTEETAGEDIPAGAECAVIEVPATYEQESDLDDLDVQLIRLPAEDPAQRRGVMLVNPGGPGAAGVSFAVDVDWPEEMRAAYDIIGFDPRGTGASSPVRCMDSQEALKTLYRLESTPRDEQEWQESDAAEQQITDDCLAEHPWWWTLTTTNTVHDMDLIRALLGEETINYYGASYGTWLGAAYLTEYPERSDRFTLDSPDMSYTRPANDSQVEQQAAIEQSIRAMAQVCAEDAECPGSTVDEVMDNLAAYLRQVDDGEIISGRNGPDGTVDGEQTLAASEALVVDGLVLLSYLTPEDSGPIFAVGMRELAAGKSGTFETYGLLQQGFELDTLEKTDFSEDALSVISCVDQDATSTPQQEQAQRAELEQRAPFLASVIDPHGFQPDDPEPGCPVSWAALADDTIPPPPAVLPPPVNDSGHPILLVGTKGDNATPYADAVEMAEALDSRLLTYEGGGHAQGLNQPCTVEYIVAYMVDGRLIEQDTTCPV